MRFSEQQERALAAVMKWHLQNKKQIFRLFGYAGTGKTTLAKYFAEELGEAVQFAAFTGKAAHVLRSKGAENAKTIHSLIYRQYGEEEIEDKKTGKSLVAPKFVLNHESPILKASLVIVDECSMVDEKLGQDLLSFDRPILVLGDPGQLPPISGGGFFTNHEPDFQLEEIFRQAKDNMILKISAEVREGKPLSYGDYGQVRIISKKDVTPELVLNADQVLVGKNRTRQLYNERLRVLKGFSGSLPQAGDKLVCLRNDAQKGLMNGSLWKVTSSALGSTKKSLRASIVSEDDNRGTVRVRFLKDAFERPDIEIPWQTKRMYDEFDYGYALTVHKAQGSQWDNVVLFDESVAFPENRIRWLYTGITRAVKSLVIVR